MSKIKKYWVIEEYYQHSNSKKLLAILDARLSYEKIINAVKVLMMSGCEGYNGILTVKSLKNDHPHYPHVCSPYPVVIGGGTHYYKAPYRAWITEFNTETGEYIDIEQMILRYPQIIF